MHTCYFIEIWTTDQRNETSLDAPPEKPTFFGFIKELKSQGHSGRLTYNWNNGNKSEECFTVVSQDGLSMELLVDCHRMTLRLLSEEDGIWGGKWTWDGNPHVGGDVRMIIATMQRPTVQEIFRSFPEPS